MHACMVGERQHGEREKESERWMGMHDGDLVMSSKRQDQYRQC